MVLTAEDISGMVDLQSAELIERERKRRRDMARYLTERDVRELFTMNAAIEAVEEGFKAVSGGQATNGVRSRLDTPKGSSSLMGAVAPAMGVMGLKTYGVVQGYPTRMYVLISSTETGEMLAVLEASSMGEIRTGAASGVATKYMARQDASTVGILGSGAYAPDQLEAVCRVRNIQTARVFSRRPEPRKKFADDMSKKLGIEVIPAESAEACIKDADVIITITRSPTAVLFGKWLEPGVHINAAGAMRKEFRELDDAAATRCDILVADDVEGSKSECGDLIFPIQAGLLDWAQVHNLSEVVAGSAPGRNAESDITLFESQGMALEDIVAGIKVYQLAIEQGVGVEMPISL